MQRSLARDTTSKSDTLATMLSTRPRAETQPIAPQNWLRRVVHDTAEAQAAGFFAFNNYSSN